MKELNSRCSQGPQFEPTQLFFENSMTSQSRVIRLHSQGEFTVGLKRPVIVLYSLMKSHNTVEEISEFVHILLHVFQFLHAVVLCPYRKNVYTFHKKKFISYRNTGLYMGNRKESGLVRIIHDWLKLSLYWSKYLLLL